MIQVLTALSATTVDDGYRRLRRQLIDQPASQLLRFLQSCLGVLLVLHSQRIVEHKRARRRSARFLTGGRAAQRWPSQCEGEKRDDRASQGQKQQLPQPKPMLIHTATLLHKSQCGE